MTFDYRHVETVGIASYTRLNRSKWPGPMPHSGLLWPRSRCVERREHDLGKLRSERGGEHAGKRRGFTGPIFRVMDGCRAPHTAIAGKVPRAKPSPPSPGRISEFSPAYRRIVAGIVGRIAERPAGIFGNFMIVIVTDAARGKMVTRARLRKDNAPPVLIPAIFRASISVI
jgi:hypothetical protein